MANKNKLPVLADLTADIEKAFKDDEMNLLLNQDPPAKWVNIHPYIKGHKYLPIDKVEFLLRRIFKRYRIEIMDKGQTFNGVFVHVRVHYMNPTDGQWDYHDGIGAIDLQVKSGSSPADLANINNGALSMAYPLAKTLAVKDACDHFGRLFGADLNRNELAPFETDQRIIDKVTERAIAVLETKETIEEIEAMPVDFRTKFANQVEERIIQLQETVKNDGVEK